MRTTITRQGDRRGVACAGRTFEEIVADARRIFADVAALLDLRLEVLEKLEAGAQEDEAEVKRLQDLIAQARKAWGTVLEIEAKLGVRASGVTLDLEVARAEIESRLDRLFAAQSACGAAGGPVGGDAGGNALPLGAVGASAASAGARG